MKDGNQLVWVLVLLFLVFSGNLGSFVGGQTAPFKATEVDVLAIYDDSPAAVVAMNKDHPGVGDILTSIAPGTVRDWVKQQGGDFRLVGKNSPDPTMDKPWVMLAWNAWKAKGTPVPWVVASSPNGRGYNAAPAETQQDMLTALKPLGVK